MGRYFDFDELTAKEPTPADDLRWLAGAISKLDAFADGTAVVCGSVSWGTNSWRSDIDVAHFSTLAHPRLDGGLEQLVDQYEDRTTGQYIRPRIDVVVVGAESRQVVAQAESISGGGSISGPGSVTEVVNDLFVDTATLFADHLQAVAARKGGPWRQFSGRFLGGLTDLNERRQAEIKRYVQEMGRRWAASPLHDLSMNDDGSFTDQQLTLMAKTENYSTNLARRVLGERGVYPSPDTKENVVEAFGALDTEWAPDLRAALQDFDHLASRYEELLSEVRTESDRPNEDEYRAEVKALFADLPFDEVESIVVERYLRAGQ